MKPKAKSSPKTAAGSTSDYRTLAEFRYQLRWFLRFSGEAARTAGLEPQQHQFLLAIKGLPQAARATVGVIAERLQIQHHSMVELADRMVQRGFVQRRRAEPDRREVILELTQKGEGVLGELSHSHADELRLLAPALVAQLQELIGRRPRGRARSAVR